MSTMDREFNKNWYDVIKFRPMGTHARCSDCEKFKEFRKLATCPEDHARITAAHRAHLQLVKRNRAVNSHLCSLSEQSVHGLFPR